MTRADARAVLAGIGADAICGIALKQRSSSDDHAEAVRMLATVRSRGNDYARDLRRLVDGMENELRGPTGGREPG